MTNIKKYTYLSGNTFFQKNGKEEGSDGATRWFADGRLHREDGPAYISDAGQSWWKNGKLHREDGPAVEYSDGVKRWYLNSQQILVNSQKEFLQFIKFIAFT
jgi:hypothetical protein